VLPKVELHLHVEGAAPPSFIRGMAREKGIDISGIFDARGDYRTGTFEHFLRVYEAATSVLTSPEDYRRLTLAVLEESAENGVVYSETFLSPDFCGGGDVEGWRDYLLAIEDGAREAEAKFGIVLRDLRPSRIGHGINAIKDPALVERLAEAGVVLEVCPGSNVYLGAVPSWEGHPIERLRAREVKVTVSTDDPPFFGTTMTREWEMLERTFGWTPDDLRELNRVALDTAFCDEATRDRVRKRLEAA
jgi:adenosine deaminase